MLADTVKAVSAAFCGIACRNLSEPGAIIYGTEGYWFEPSGVYFFKSRRTLNLRYLPVVGSAAS